MDAQSGRGRGMCEIDNRNPCYHAAVPAVDWRSGERPKVGAQVTVPLWDRGEVLGWVPAVVISAECVFAAVIVRLSSGRDDMMFLYSLGRPGTGGRG